MKNEIVKIESTQLEKVVTESGLAIQEGEEIKKSYLPFLVQLAEIQAQATKINFESPAEIDETIARELRLKTVKIRTGSKDLKDERKKGYLLRGNLEQAAYNLIEASCKLTEDTFVNVEKAREFAEKKRKEQLRSDRTEKLLAFIPVESMYLYALSEMSEDQFDDLYSGLQLAAEKKVAEEKRIESERIAKEKKDAEEREAQRLENIRLQKQAEEREKQIIAERENAAKILAEQKAKDAAKIEKEILYQKQIVKEAEIEREKQADILAKQKAAADKERAELLAKNQANIEKAEKERKEKEQLLAKIEYEKQVQQKIADAAKKAQLQTEKKAKLAPDKDKLLNFMQAIHDLPRPEVKSIEAGEIAANANTLLVKVANYIRDNASKL
jgi:hypothetical protein